jgi:hypothetical protein
MGQKLALMGQNIFTTKSTKGTKEKAKMQGNDPRADLISDEVSLAISDLRLARHLRGLRALRGEFFLSD